MQIQTKIIDKRLNQYLDDLYATEGSAAIDLRACIDEPIVLQPGEHRFISSGLSIFINDINVAAIIIPRSGLGAKDGVILRHCIGLVDSDYQGIVHIPIKNSSEEEFEIVPMAKVVQMVFIPVLKPQMVFVNEFSEFSSRGEGGFGSTGYI